MFHFPAGEALNIERPFYIQRSHNFWQMGAYLLVGPPESAKSAVALDICKIYSDNGYYIFYFDLNDAILGQRVLNYVFPNGFYVVKPADLEHINNILSNGAFRKEFRFTPILFVFDGLDKLEENGEVLRYKAEVFRDYVSTQFAKSSVLFVEQDYEMSSRDDWTDVLYTKRGPTVRNKGSYEVFGRLCSLLGNQGEGKYLIDFRTGRPSWAFDEMLDQQSQGVPSGGTFTYREYSKVGRMNFVLESPTDKPK